MSKIIGIDLGTTNSCVSIMEGGQPKVLINSQGNRTTPSVVAFTEKGERLIGQPARHQQVTNPKNTVFSIKRFMGRKHSEVQHEEKLVPFSVTSEGNEGVKVDIRGKKYTAPEISALILQNLKKIAEDYLGEKVDRAVITVPAYFNDAQRQATKDAGEIAGLKVERIINEPTAAALAYGLEKKKSGKVVVFDLGGGTFDVSILDIGDGVFEVLSSNGDGHLGGDDFDQKLIDHIAEEFRKKEGIDIRKDPMSLQRLKESAEKAKIELSTQMETTINLPFITADQNGPKHLQVTVTRSAFESMCSDLFERLAAPCTTCIKDAGIDLSDIKEVIMVGGSIRIPKVQEITKQIFKKTELDNSINPDEVVAIGAAIQGGVLQGDVKDVLLLDVTPLSLGIEIQGGIVSRLIEKNTTIPTSKKEIYSTAADNQPAVTIHAVQGERQFANDNHSLGRFDLQGISPAPRGVPQIEVEFNIDANGILNVTATDKASGKKQEIRITDSSGLSKEQIEKMKVDAELNEVSDRDRRELVELRNQAESVIFTAEKSIRENGNTMTPDVLSGIETAMSSLKNIIKEDSKEAITTAIKVLMEVMAKVECSKNTCENKTSAKTEDVQEAEYETI